MARRYTPSPSPPPPPPPPPPPSSSHRRNYGGRYPAHSNRDHPNSRLGPKRSSHISDRLGKKIEDRLGPRMNDRLGPSVKKNIVSKHPVINKNIKQKRINQSTHISNGSGSNWFKSATSSDISKNEHIPRKLNNRNLNNQKPRNMYDLDKPSINPGQIDITRTIISYDDNEPSAGDLMM